MNSSMEYLLAGLPIVNTPNLGGRDLYFSPDYCITADADPDSVRDAVLELKARNIPRGYIRAQTLEKIKPDRERFLNFLSELGVALPSNADAFANWPFPDKLIGSSKLVGKYLPEMGL